MRTLTDEGRGWLAGLFEGEGTFRANVRGSYKPQVRAAISQVDRSVLDRVVELTGIGRLSGPYTDSRPHTRMQPYYVWTLTRAEDLDAFTVALFPLLSQRRQEQVLAAYARRSV